MKKLAISVSGGGMLGIGPLHFMCRLENDYGIKIDAESVAFSGTSTGAIIAAMLADGHDAHEIFNLYKDNVKKIFTKYPLWKRILPKVPKYNNKNLKNMLKDNLKGKCGDWTKPVFIPATFMNGQSVEKVWDKGDADTDKWVAVLTSTAAPTYFDIIVDDEGRSFCDGGLWKNSPVTILNAGLNRSEYRGNVKILSFDTGMTTPNTASGNKTLLGWADYLISDFVARSARSGDYEVKADIGADNVFLASPVHDKKLPMDATDDESVEAVIEIWDKYYDSVKAELDKFMAR